MSDKIAEIRARHTGDANDAAVLNPELSPTWALAGWRAHNDRAWLLAEDARHRAEIEKLTRERDEARAEVERLRGTIRQVALAADGCISRDKIVCICHEALEAKP